MFAPVAEKAREEQPITLHDPAEKPMIAVRALVKTYGALPVLRKLDLSVARGAFLALLGPNGSGKSTLLKLLCGLSKASAGQISIGGWELPREAAQVRAQIGLVSHKSLLYEALTAHENLRFFARLYNIPSAAREARITALLGRVGLAKRANDYVRSFSRGMQQRLSIARALLHDPHILLFDEPHTGLDQEAAATLDEMLRAAHAEGHTIVMVTHEIERAAALANRIAILAQGRIAFDAQTADLNAEMLAERYKAVTNIEKVRV